MNMYGSNTQVPGGGQYGGQQIVDCGPSYDRMWSQSSTSPWDSPPPQDYISPPQDYSQPPLWDTDPSDPACAWDLDLSRQLATKLLLLDSRPEKQQEEIYFDSSPPAPSNPRFKTEICRNFKEKGACVYGGLCQFAHGKHELRQDVVRHTKYKTKLCQKYWIAGYCAYGPRCNFVHQEIEKQFSQDREPFPEVTTSNKPAVIRRAVSGYTRPQQTFPSTLVRNVSDVIRISKIRAGSQGGESGGDSGSDQGGAWTGNVKPQGRQVFMESESNFPNPLVDNLQPTANTYRQRETREEATVGWRRALKRFLAVKELLGSGIINFF